MKKLKNLKIVVIVVVITITLTFVAATNSGYSRGLFKPQIIKQKHIGNDDLYEVLTSYEIWRGNGTGDLVTPDGDTIHPWAAWEGTVRTAGGNKVITGTWKDYHLSPPAYGGFTGNIDANGYVTNGIWWADNPQLPNSGSWHAQFNDPEPDTMHGEWYYSDQNGSAHGDIYGKRTQ